ncbi:DUF397 domain-containing protein [Kineosporia babensis]|uniref:DUF397 domain-containing protein n=1 Tax=Kineosporia babensis TaxID=499548 RepID=UPI0038B3B4B7
MTPTPDPSAWVKASRSGPDNECVEMRCTGGAVEIRDTKANGAGPTLRSAPAGFASWLAGAKRGEFDGLIGA